jgi:tetratricopeptide (TPR) repeat protein
MKPSLAVFLFASALAAQSSSETILSALKDRAIVNNVERMKTDDRIRMYQTLVDTNENNRDYRNLLASAYIQKVRETSDFSYLERAARAVESVLNEEGSNYEALRLRSLIELERHNFAKVASLSREMTRIAPDDSWNWGTLGDAQMELGRYEEAAVSYQKMVSIKPDLASYNRAAFYRFVAGDVEGALHAMKLAVGAGSGSNESTAWCLAELGNLLFKTGRADEAERAYRAALAVFPGYHPAHFGIGRVEAGQGRLEAAIESIRRAQASVPLVEYAAALQDLYERTGKKEEARTQAGMIDIVDKVARAAGEKANRNLALVFADFDRNLARSLELAQAEMSVRQDVYTHDALAWALYKNGKYEEAAKAAGAALKLGTPEPSFHYHAGMIAAALGKKDEAKKYLERALALNPKFDLRQVARAEAALKELGL